MGPMSDITIRPVTDDEYPAFVTAIMEGFSEDLVADDFPEYLRRNLPAERTLAAFDEDGSIVGTFGGYHLDLTVPGGTMPMEGTTVVTVFPTHRRQGLLRRMMDLHLDNAAAAGYPVAGLWASESNIYGRFGYGPASFNNALRLDGPLIVFRNDAPVGKVRRIAADDAPELLPPVFDRVLAKRPGMYARTSAWWSADVLTDADWARQGRTSKRFVVHDGPDGIDGYVIYRQKSAHGDDAHANGEVVITELITETAAAHASIWSYLTRIDGCPNVTSWNTPMDDPLPKMVLEPRRVQLKGAYDALWIRILDVVAALTGRTYEQDGELVLDVADADRPAIGGTFRLSIIGGTATCERSDDPADLSIDVDVLGALLLGDGGGHTYAAANRIRGAEEDVRVLDELFRTQRRPWCNQVF